MTGIRDLRQITALFAILFTAAVWGVSFISTKSLLISGLTPVQIVFVRFTIACVILVGLHILQRTGKQGRRLQENPAKAPRDTRIRMIAGGIIGIPVYFLLENTGLRFTAASTASLITGTVPVINALALVSLSHGRVSSPQWAGIILSCFGVYAVTQADLAASLTGYAMLGNLLVFLSSCSWVAYTMINLGEPLSWMKALGGTLAIAGVYLVSVGEHRFDGVTRDTYGRHHS